MNAPVPWVGSREEAMAPKLLHGPLCPKPVLETMIRSGLTALRLG